MFEELDRLRGDDRLAQLLAHYAEAGKVDRHTWRDRVMEMPGVEPREVSGLHGVLIAFDWIEQNTGHGSNAGEPIGARCYRVTLHGLRTIARLTGSEYVEAPQTAKEDTVAPRRKKRNAATPVEGEGMPSPQVGEAA